MSRVSSSSSLVTSVCLVVLGRSGEVTAWLMVVKSPDWRSVMARGELFLCLKVKDGSFLVDEVVCSVDSPVWRVSYSFETLDLLVYGLTLCLLNSCASASFWFVCFISQFGPSIYTLLRGISSLRFLPACGLCLDSTFLIFQEVRTWLSLSDSASV